MSMGLEKFAETVEDRLDGYAKEAMERPGYREKLAAYDHLVSESSRVVYLPWSVVSMYAQTPYTGTIPTIPVLYSPKVLEKAKDEYQNPRNTSE